MAGTGASRELLQGAIGIGVYVIAALAYSTIYQATVKLRLWKQSFESVELSNVEVLDRVRAARRPARRSAKALPTRCMSAGFDHGGRRHGNLLRRRDQREAPRR